MVICKRGWRDTRPGDRIASTERPAQVVARCVEQHGCHWTDRRAHSQVRVWSQHTLASQAAPCTRRSLPASLLLCPQRQLAGRKSSRPEPEDAEVLKENEANAYSVRS